MSMQDNTNIVIDNNILLGEDDYSDSMKKTVRPLLDANRKSGYFHSSDDTKIFYEYYINPQEKAAIVISHGFCEFTSKFEEVAFHFFQAGYSVFLLDYRGHGYSKRMVEDKCKVHVHSYNEYILDLHCYITNIVMQNSLQNELVLYAHSMGGAIGALYLEQYPDVFSCAILSSPMLEMDVGKNPEFLVWLVLLYAKFTGNANEYVRGHKGFDGNPKYEKSSCLSKARYDYIFAKRVQDTNYQTYGGTCAWTLASMKAVKKLQKQANLVTAPVLLFQAGNDTVVKAGGQKRFCEKSKNTRLEVIPYSKHEIYNADIKTRESYYNKIFEFLNNYVSL